MISFCRFYDLLSTNFPVLPRNHPGNLPQRSHYYPANFPHLPQSLTKYPPH